MDVAELSELYQKALKVKDAAVRGSVAQGVGPGFSVDNGDVDFQYARSSYR